MSIGASRGMFRRPSARLPAALTFAQRSRYQLRFRRPFVRRPMVRQPIFRGGQNRYRSRRFAPRRDSGFGRSGRVLPLGVVVRRALGVVPGQLRGANLIGNLYLIKILSRSGRLVYVYADARTGRIARIRR